MELNLFGFHLLATIPECLEGTDCLSNLAKMLCRQSFVTKLVEYRMKRVWLRKRTWLIHPVLHNSRATTLDSLKGFVWLSTLNEIFCLQILSLSLKTHCCIQSRQTANTACPHLKSPPSPLPHPWVLTDVFRLVYKIILIIWQYIFRLWSSFYMN